MDGVFVFLYFKKYPFYIQQFFKSQVHPTRRCDITYHKPRKLNSNPTNVTSDIIQFTPYSSFTKFPHTEIYTASGAALQNQPENHIIHSPFFLL